MDDRKTRFPPGKHTIDFEWQSRQKLIGPLSLMTTTCRIEADLVAGERYVFDPNLERTRLERMPTHERRWTRYRIAPTLRASSTGESLPGLQCAPLCRVASRRGTNTETRSCNVVDGAGTDESVPLRGTPDFERIQRGESPTAIEDRDFAAEALAREAVERVRDSCREPEGETRNACLFRSMQYIPFRVGQRGLLVFVPGRASDPAPGAYRRARDACTSDLSGRELKECLAGFGWELLPPPD
ncbi:MAG: hypothetical protein NXI30_18405 [bacterium]|nr:hypothetical protein [bacterium]